MMKKYEIMHNESQALRMASGVQCETGGRVRTDVSSFFSSASNDKVDDTAPALLAKSVGRGVYVYETSKKRRMGRGGEEGGRETKSKNKNQRKGWGGGQKTKSKNKYTSRN